MASGPQNTTVDESKYPDAPIYGVKDDRKQQMKDENPMTIERPSPPLVEQLQQKWEKTNWHSSAVGQSPAERLEAMNKDVNKIVAERERLAKEKQAKEDEAWWKEEHARQEEATQNKKHEKDTGIFRKFSSGTNILPTHNAIPIDKSGTVRDIRAPGPIDEFDLTGGRRISKADREFGGWNLPANTKEGRRGRNKIEPSQEEIQDHFSPAIRGSPPLPKISQKEAMDEEKRERQERWKGFEPINQDPDNYPTLHDMEGVTADEPIQQQQATKQPEMDQTSKNAKTWTESSMKNRLVVPTYLPPDFRAHKNEPSKPMGEQPTFKGDLSQKWEDAKEKAESVKEKVEDKVDSAKDKIEGTYESAKDKVIQWKDKAEDKLSDLKADVKEKGTELKEKAKEAGAEVKEKVKEGAEKVKEGAEKVEEEGKGLLGHLKDSAWNPFSSSTSSAINHHGEIKERQLKVDASPEGVTLRPASKQELQGPYTPFVVPKKAQPTTTTAVGTPSSLRGLEDSQPLPKRQPIIQTPVRVDPVHVPLSLRGLESNELPSEKKRIDHELELAKEQRALKQQQRGGSPVPEDFLESAGKFYENGQKKEFKFVAHTPPAQQQHGWLWKLAHIFDRKSTPYSDAVERRASAAVTPDTTATTTANTPTTRPLTREEKLQASARDFWDFKAQEGRPVLGPRPQVKNLHDTLKGGGGDSSPTVDVTPPTLASYGFDNDTRERSFARRQFAELLAETME